MFELIFLKGHPTPTYKSLPLLQCGDLERYRAVFVAVSNIMTCWTLSVAYLLNDAVHFQLEIVWQVIIFELRTNQEVSYGSLDL